MCDGNVRVRSRRQVGVGGGGVYFFFFKGEDGIRDLVRSRGLGDVYKRQLQRDVDQRVGDRGDARLAQERDQLGHVVVVHRVPVSYTHLTLPTSDLV